MSLTLSPVKATGLKHLPVFLGQSRQRALDVKLGFGVVGRNQGKGTLRYFVIPWLLWNFNLSKNWETLLGSSLKYHCLVVLFFLPLFGQESKKKTTYMIHLAQKHDSPPQISSHYEELLSQTWSFQSAAGSTTKQNNQCNHFLFSNQNRQMWFKEYSLLISIRGKQVSNCLLIS